MRFVIAMVIALASYSTPLSASAAEPSGVELPATLWGERYFGSVTSDEWGEFASKFVTSDGRVRDTANEGMSHSEGQGYGMLLAWMAGAVGDFERMWHFTHNELQIRDDGLLSWTWENDEIPHVTDVNNATDGDVLTAYALLLAGKSWKRPELYAEGLELVRSIRATLVVQHPEFGAVLLPGHQGFDANGAVVNPSYWIYEALLTFADADPSGPWRNLVRSGDAIVKASHRVTGSSLPPEWILLPIDGGVAIPPDKSAVFGYNAIRVPLYEIRAGGKPSAAIAEMVRRDGVLTLPPVGLGDRSTDLSDPGYKQLAALIGCVSGTSQTLAASSGSFIPEDYYPSALRLLSLSGARVMNPQCLSGRS